MRFINPKNHGSACAGLTLIEVTLVVSVLLGLISFSFVGANAYKEGADRATCILHIVEVQKGLRSFCNFHERKPGDTVSGLKGAIIGPNRFVDVMPVCPSGGEYLFTEDEVPAMGTTFMRCSIVEHEPATTNGW